MWLVLVLDLHRPRPKHHAITLRLVLAVGQDEPPELFHRLLRLFDPSRKVMRYIETNTVAKAEKKLLKIKEYFAADFL